MNAGASVAPADRVRIDKWLWAARFFKTRSLAAQAVEGGRVHLNDQRVKPARDLRVGDQLTVSIGGLEWEIRVEILSDRRGSATVARQLYSESDESRAKREAAAAARKEHAEPAFGRQGRPTKRDRRMIKRFTGE